MAADKGNDVFKAGDLVKLKTGAGPKMVVSRDSTIGEMPPGAKGWVVCSFWSKVAERFVIESFNPATLRRPNPHE